MTINEFAHEIKALRDEARAKYGVELHHANPYFALEEWQHQLFMMLFVSDNPPAYLKQHTKKETE